MGMKEPFRKCFRWFSRFAEDRGFAVVTVLCVAVITATAVWTDQRADDWVAPTPPPAGDVSAAQLMQESLRAVVTLTPSPTREPHPWTAPLESISILRSFDAATMVRSETTGIWRIHDGVDLQAPTGTRVFSMTDGTVAAAGKDQLLGCWLTIDHGSGIEALYAGMSLTDAYIAGDRVYAGDPIGYTGNGVLAEQDLPPHLHLRVSRNGQLIDPISLWGEAVPGPTSQPE